MIYMPTLDLHENSADSAIANFELVTSNQLSLPVGILYMALRFYSPIERVTHFSIPSSNLHSLSCLSNCDGTLQSSFTGFITVLVRSKGLS